MPCSVSANVPTLSTELTVVLYITHLFSEFRCPTFFFPHRVLSISSRSRCPSLSQHPIPAVAPVDEEGSDGEPDQEAVQR